LEMNVPGADEGDRVGGVGLVRDGGGVAAQQRRGAVRRCELRLRAGGAEELEGFGTGGERREYEQRACVRDPSPSTRLGMTRPTRLGMTRVHHLPSASLVNMRSGLSCAARFV